MLYYTCKSDMANSPAGRRTGGKKMDWYEKLFLVMLLGVGIAGVAVNVMTIVTIHNALN